MNSPKHPRQPDKNPELKATDLKQCDANLESIYANNTWLESSIWDLKVIFGQLEQHTGNPEINWKTAVTLPWSQVKVLSFLLRVNLAVHERQSGAITLPANVLPPKPNRPDGDPKSNRNEFEIYDLIVRMHAEEFGST